MDLAAEIANGHGYLGYAVLAVLAGTVGWAVVQARSGGEYGDGAPRLAGLLVALQWLYGIVVYIQRAAWGADWPLAYVHPLAMTAAVGLVGIATARARRATEAQVAWMQVARLQGFALVSIIIGIWAATAG